MYILNLFRLLPSEALATYFFINSNKEVSKKLPPQTYRPTASLASLMTLTDLR